MLYFNSNHFLRIFNVFLDKSSFITTTHKKIIPLKYPHLAAMSNHATTPIASCVGGQLRHNKFGTFYAPV